jgi:hypothetical protein
MARGMQRLLSLLLLVFAVTALAAPSLTLGLGLNRLAHTHGGATVASDGAPLEFTTCKGLGGKRLMPCQPDLGVLSAALDKGRQAVPSNLLLLLSIPSPLSPPEAELPPPRLG